MVVQLLGVDAALLTATTQADTRGGATDDCSLVLATGKERQDLAALRPASSGGAKCWRAHATDSHVTWTLSTLSEGISWDFFAYDRTAEQVSTLARYDFGQPAETELPDGGSLPIVLDGTAYLARPTEANNYPSERQIVAVPLSGGEAETIARGSDVFDFGDALGVLAGEGPIEGQPQATFAAQRAGEDASRPVPVVFGNLGKDTLASSPVVVGNTLAFVAGPAGYVLERASGTLYRLPEDDLSGGAFLAPDGAIGFKTSDLRSDRQHVGRIATGTWAD
ncbi:hypothetical protein BSZ39_09645 [Bowdeniella nasicola]|uniref:Uncharacterized protein n=1 Tax=Bowdeniella nasicola TaxID=208480 RepID=A0A1Q5Q0W9_9ACTO|nr:hypothetical protein [Bowdeniella nasicola]OKL53406.1 hypothetical protein BSZ39_09645 [Bowdeniella nasicola]